MKPVFNKTEKIEKAIKFWNQELHVSLILSLLLILMISNISVSFWFDLFMVVFIINLLFDAGQAYYHKSKWSKILKDGGVDEVYFD